MNVKQQQFKFAAWLVCCRIYDSSVWLTVSFLECHYASLHSSGKEYSLPQDMLNYASAATQVAIFVFFQSTMSADRLR